MGSVKTGTQKRKIGKVWKSRATLEGAGVHLKRAFGFQQVPQLDPFLLLDDFHSDKPDEYLKGFPWHPHRGIETITYVLEGRVEHGDSMRNSGVISSGDVQWMTAGSGIIHQEMPRGNKDGILWGFQLWANLPASHKMMDPRYREIKEEQIPVVSLDNGAKVKVICGEINGIKGPVRDIMTDPEYLDITVPAKSEFTHHIKAGITAVAYVIDGKGFFDEERNPFGYDREALNYCDPGTECLFSAETVVLYERSGDRLFVSTEESPVRFLLVTGRPIGEPVAWYGPIVMNTREELVRAFDEYDRGTFIKYRGH